MNLEESIKNVIAKELEKGIVEEVIQEQLKNSIEKAIEGMFGYCGSVKTVLEKQIESVMIPYIEQYDYSEYITKMDSVLVDVLKSSTLDNKNILQNFSHLIDNSEDIKEVKISDIYAKWCENVERQVDQDKLEMDYDGGYATTSLVVEDMSNSWSDIKRYAVVFECGEDESLNVEFIISMWEKYDNTGYTIQGDKIANLNTLRFIDEFQVYMMKLEQVSAKLIIDTECEHDDLHIEYQH